MKSQKTSNGKKMMAVLAFLMLAIPAISLATLDDYDLRLAEIMNYGGNEETLSSFDLLIGSLSNLITRAISQPINSGEKIVLVPPAEKLSVAPVALSVKQTAKKDGLSFAYISGKIKEGFVALLSIAKTIKDGVDDLLSSFDSSRGQQLAEVMNREDNEKALSPLESLLGEVSNLITRVTSIPFSPAEEVVLIPPAKAAKEPLVVSNEKKGTSLSVVSSMIKENLVALLVKVEAGVKEADLLNHRVERKEKPVPVEIKPQEPKEWRITRYFKDMAEYSSLTFKKFKTKVGRITKIFKMPELPAEENVPTVVLSDILSKAEIQKENSYLNMAVNYAYSHTKNLSVYPFSGNAERVTGWIDNKPNFAKTQIFSVVVPEQSDGILRSVGNVIGEASDVAFMWASQAKNRLSALLISAMDEVIHTPDAVEKVLADEPSAPKGDFEKKADVYLNKFDNMVNGTFDKIKGAAGKFFNIFNK